jgi:hypothetical protein
MVPDPYDHGTIEPDAHRVIDRRGAFGEHRQQLFRHAGDLGLALHDWPPPNPEAVGNSLRSTDWYRPPSIR